MMIAIWRHSSLLVGRHAHPAWCLADLHAVFVRGYQVGLCDPLSRTFLRHSHLNPIFVYALYYASVTLQRTRAYYNCLSDLEFLVLGTSCLLLKARFGVWPAIEFFHSLGCLCQNCAIVRFLSSNSRGLVE